ncbi:hypothetical protein BC938DRAFT_474392 [Jimgerdemannia flammicorona]|uniref:Uncharacterized protein n=1 Tax=Jimgerdemannia flammicorona TaxID=994334 RepID=A0A433QZI4_9FUNG|nr:hypothetical protein BC938DRAFT_474392 [Jimgerdemannia flammicorona]
MRSKIDRSRFDVGQYMGPRVTPPAPSARKTNDDPRPIQQYGNSEPVISCTWVPTGSPKLVAGMMKSVKIYDLRVESTAASISFSTKAVYGINVDPFHTHRADIIRASATVGLSRIAFSPTRSGLLATLSRDARVVCLWDIQESFPRSSQLSNASFLSATQRAAAATGAAGGGTNPPSTFSTAATGVAIPSGMVYSGLNMGINLQVSPGAMGTVLVSPGVVGGSDMERGASNTGSGMSADSSSGEEDASDTLVLWKSRKTQPSSKILSSFAWMPHSSTQSANSASVHRLISVNKDGFIEAVRLQEAPKFSWEPTGNILLTGGGGLEIHGTYHSPPSASTANDADQTHTGAGSLNNDVPLGYQRAALRKQNLLIPRSMSGTSFLRVGSQQQDPSFLRLSTSLQTNSTSTTDNSTGGPTPLARNGVFYHRPGELQQRRANQPSMLSKPMHLDIGHGRLGGARPERAADDVIVYVEGSTLIKELQMDMSVVMKGRATNDYSMDCETNQKKLKYHRKLSELWSWMAQSEHLASETKTHTGAVDYSFQGIHAVWMGSNTASQNHKKVSPLSTPKTTSPLTRPLVHQPAHVNISLQESTSSSSSPTGTSATLDQNAAAALNLGRGTSNVSPDDELEIVPTARQAQRRLALWMCGFGFTKTQLEVELGNLEESGENEKAAGWALFSGQTERAIKALNNSSDQSRKLMSAALAGYQNNTSQAKDGNGDTLWQNLARSMANDLKDDPYLRTMFAYLASDDWDVVLGEKQLSLRERVAVALRVLTDDELTVYVENLVRQVVAEGDIEGLFLTGLTKEGVDLFEQYVNSTDDIQTAALALSFCVPSKFQDRRVDEWVESYRLLLDRWQLYHTRARFDIERGKRYGPTPGAAAEITPSQVYVQCRFCAQSLAHSVQIQNVRNRDGRRIMVQANVNPNAGGRKKSTVCPSCSKPLPRCALCLLNLGTPTDSLRQTMATNGIPRGSISGSRGAKRVVMVAMQSTCVNGLRNTNSVPSATVRADASIYEDGSGRVIVQL